MSIADKLTTIAENVQKVYEAGKETGKNDILPTMWSAIVSPVARSYQNAFANLVLDNTTFKPEKMFRITEAFSMFDSCSVGLEEEKQVDLIEYEQQTGINILNLTQCTKMNKAFYKCGLFKRLNWVDLSNNPITSLCFSYSTIQRIEFFTPPTTAMNNCFSNASNLSYIGFDSDVHKSVNLQSCPLVNESAIMLLQNLVDYSGTENEFVNTVTLNDEVWANLDALGNVSPNENTWRQYCNDIGWST